jgi:hypothetical protein
MDVDDISDEDYDRITALCAEGDALAKDHHYAAARLKFEEGLRMLPGDPLEWEMGTWIYIALGDVDFLSGDMDSAHDNFISAVQGVGGLGQPFIHFRLGQIAFGQNRLERAADELTRAYMGAGLEIFKDEDPRLLAFLRTRIHMDE